MMPFPSKSMFVSFSCAVLETCIELIEQIFAVIRKQRNGFRSNMRFIEMFFGALLRGVSLFPRFKLFNEYPDQRLGGNKLMRIDLFLDTL